MEEEEQEDKDIEELLESNWFDRVPFSDKVKISLARAFIVNPEVLVLHQPLSALKSESIACMLDAFRQYVQASLAFRHCFTFFFALLDLDFRIGTSEPVPRRKFHVESDIPIKKITNSSIQGPKDTKIVPRNID